jgi:hypothetical protein
MRHCRWNIALTRLWTRGSLTIVLCHREGLLVKRINGFDLPMSAREWVDPDRTALLVYDMQIGICGQVESTAVIASIERLLAAARAAGMRVIFTRHMSLPTALMGRMAYRTAMAWQRTDDPNAVKPWFLRDSPGFGLVPELAPSADEVVFDKITMSAFEGTPLAITPPILVSCQS